MPILNRAEHHDEKPGALRIGIVNNMQGTALKNTERQFLDLLAMASRDLPLRVDFYAVKDVSRSAVDQGSLHQRFYRNMGDLERGPPDGVIVTGTEPKAADLRDEAYWPSFMRLFDWIESDGPSAIFSCLAAHAAVLHYDGVARKRLAQKRFGMFDHLVVRPHRLTSALGTSIRVPHSRWNEVSVEALSDSGYQILTLSPDAGADLFVKPARNPLLFFQGHPEYDAQTLHREYQRDVRRYLAGDQENYPDLPRFYFEERDEILFEAFAVRAKAERIPALMEGMPAVRPMAPQHPPAVSIYRAWLLQLEEAKSASGRTAGYSTQYARAVA